MHRSKIVLTRIGLGVVAAVSILVCVYLFTTSRNVDAPNVMIGDTPLQATFAINDADRMRGLSGMPVLNGNQAKVFVFDSDSNWSIWMKDMNGPIDIIWLNASKKVVHIVHEAQPSSYPETTFTPPVKSRYVVETASGFTTQFDVRIGDQSTFNELES